MYYNYLILFSGVTSLNRRTLFLSIIVSLISNFSPHETDLNITFSHDLPLSQTTFQYIYPHPPLLLGMMLSFLQAGRLK